MEESHRTTDEPDDEPRTRVGDSRGDEPNLDACMTHNLLELSFLRGLPLLRQAVVPEKVGRKREETTALTHIHMYLHYFALYKFCNLILNCIVLGL